MRDGDFENQNTVSRCGTRALKTGRAFLDTIWSGFADEMAVAISMSNSFCMTSRGRHPHRSQPPSS